MVNMVVCMCACVIVARSCPVLLFCFGPFVTLVMVPYLHGRSCGSSSRRPSSLSCRHATGHAPLRRWHLAYGYGYVRIRVRIRTDTGAALTKAEQQEVHYCIETYRHPELVTSCAGRERLTAQPMDRNVAGTIYRIRIRIIARFRVTPFFNWPRPPRRRDCNHT